jgi:hypothetical protein
MKRLALTAAWLLGAPLLLGATVAIAYKIKVSHEPSVIALEAYNPIKTSRTLSAQEPIVSQVKGLSTSVQTADARPIIIAEFLEQNDSPLKPYDYFGRYLTSLADKYNLDFRLLPSIMMQESNLCKKIPDDSYNCLGLGIHSQGTWTFARYEDNFEAAAKILREKYLDQGLLTPEEIQNKYTPKSNGSWEFAVNHFMDILETAEFVQ